MAKSVDARAVDVRHGACRAKFQIPPDEGHPNGIAGPQSVRGARGRRAGRRLIATGDVERSPHLAVHLPTPDLRTQWLILAAGGTPCGRHAAVAAALELTAGDASSTPAGLPAWFASRFPQAPSLQQQEDGRHWLRRFIGPSAQTLGRQWAIAVPEPLFHRHGLTGMTRPPMLSAPSQVPQRQQALIRKELGLDLDPLADDSNDDGLTGNERDIVKDAAREKAAEKRPDPLLRESAAILADAVNLLAEDRPLSAQVLPQSTAAGRWAD